MNDYESRRLGDLRVAIRASYEAFDQPIPSDKNMERELEEIENDKDFKYHVTVQGKWEDISETYKKIDAMCEAWGNVKALLIPEIIDYRR